MERTRSCQTRRCAERGLSRRLIRHGTFLRKEDGRRINKEVRRLLTIKVGQRAIARHLGIDPKTVDRKLQYWGRISRRYFANLKVRDLESIQFDEIQSSIHPGPGRTSVPR
jgi:NADH/NAD ratio-sensing transcriptional regulator Rex